MKKALKTSIWNWVLKDLALTSGGDVLKMWACGTGWVLAFWIISAVYFVLGMLVNLMERTFSVALFLEWNVPIFIGVIVVISALSFLFNINRRFGRVKPVHQLVDSFLEGYFELVSARFFGKSSRYSRMRKKYETALAVAKDQLHVLKTNASDSAHAGDAVAKIEQAIAGLKKDVEALDKYSEALDVELKRMAKMRTDMKFQAFLTQLEAVETAGKLGNCLADVQIGYFSELEKFFVGYRAVEEAMGRIPFPKMTMRLK